MDRDRPGWDEDVAGLCEALRALPPARTVDLACGTGFLTRFLPGEVTGVDQSEAMLAIARERRPDATFVAGDALAFDTAGFERVFTSHFYGHLDEAQRARVRASRASSSWSTRRSAASPRIGRSACSTTARGIASIKSCSTDCASPHAAVKTE